MPRATDLYSRWSLEMRRARLFAAGERVGVAVSGGPDSILLLDFMHQLGQQLGLYPVAVHFNHHLRGADSDADERFVAELAEEWGLEYLRGHANVARIAREKHRNLEATARELRYRFFVSLVNQGKLDRVATAHTANDQAETVLLRLCRGADMRGFGGIFPRLEGGKVVRPFLSVTRAEVEAEIEARSLAFRVDRSNLDPRFTRNKIRLELLPYLEKEFNPAIIPLLKNLASRAREDEACLEQLAAEQARPWRIREGEEERIPLRSLAQFPPAIARRVLRQMIASARGGRGGYTAQHLEQLLWLATEGPGGKSIVLPGGIEACKEFDWLIVRPQGRDAPPLDFCFQISPPAEIPISQLGVKFRFRIVENLPGQGEKTYNKEGIQLDFEKLGGSLVLRNRRPGDRLRPVGSRKAHKLKDLFQERQIPRELRRLWPVLLNGEEIIWVRHFPPATSFAASPLSRQLMVIEETSLEGDSSRPEVA